MRVYHYVLIIAIILANTGTHMIVRKPQELQLILAREEGKIISQISCLASIPGHGVVLIIIDMVLVAVDCFYCLRIQHDLIIT